MVENSLLEKERERKRVPRRRRKGEGGRKGQGVAEPQLMCLIRNTPESLEDEEVARPSDSYYHLTLLPFRRKFSETRGRENH